MALTKISTDGISDDAVTTDKLANAINTARDANTAKTTNATHSGEVTGATALTIADNVVDEANLKVSNSPTNGYFLSAQSGNTGGLTWAQVSTDLVADTSPQLGGNLDTNSHHILLDDDHEVMFGDNSDLRIFHANGNANFIQSYNDVDLRIHTFGTTANVRLQVNESENAVVCSPNGAVELYYDNSKKFETQSGGVKAFGNFLIPDGYQVRLGNDNDAQLYHSGSHAYLTNATGNLNLASDGEVGIYGGSDSGEFMARFIDNGAVELYHNNSKKFETTSTGTLFSAGTADFRGVSGSSYTVEVNPTYVNPYGLWCREPSSFNNGYPLFAVTNNGGQTYFRTLSGGISEARNIQPVTNNTYDLGTSSVRWRNIYTNDLNLSNEGSSNDVDGTWGSYTIQEGAESLFLINKRNGKKYKFNLTEVS